MPTPQQWWSDIWAQNAQLPSLHSGRAGTSVCLLLPSPLGHHTPAPQKPTCSLSPANTGTHILKERKGSSKE